MKETRSRCEANGKSTHEKLKFKTFKIKKKNFEMYFPKK